MSGGRLVVLDRSGRPVKRYSLGAGLATLGSAPHCDIRVMLASVCSHHATVAVHAAQTVVRNVGEGETLVNGVPVSVAALRHGDRLSVGGRVLRWEYAAPGRGGRRGPRGGPPDPPLAPSAGLPAGGAPAGGAPRRHTAAAPGTPRSPALRLALELRHRASHPGNTGGKQVAIVQPQRRDTTEQNDQSEEVGNKRRGAWSSAGPTPSTKASQWIESRKPASHTPQPNTQPAKHNTPRLATPKPNTPKIVTSKPNTPKIVTPKTNTPKIVTPKPNTPKTTTPRTNTPRVTPRNVTPKPKTTKIPVPRSNPPRTNTSRTNTPRSNTSRNNTPKVNVNKRSTPKSAPAGAASARSPLRIGALKNARRHRLTKIQDPPGIDHTKQAAILLMTGHAPRGRLSLGKQGSVRRGGTTPLLLVGQTSPLRQPRSAHNRSPRHSRGSAVNVSANDVSEAESSTTESQPRKSALRGRSSVRKHDSIRFDLSNLGLESDTDISLHYSETSTLTAANSPTLSLSPSSRRSIHSRSSKILEKSVGTPIEASIKSTRSTLTPTSPASKSRRSTRGTFIVQQALNDSATNYSRRTTKSMSDSQAVGESAFQTKTLSPSSRNLETYSIVDLVSVDSERSIYDSAGSVDTSFGTPRDRKSSRRSRSTIDLGMAESSTPYVGRTRKTRSVTSRSSSMKSAYESNASIESIASPSPKRSRSMTDATQKDVTVDTTKASRSSRSRSQVDDSDLLLISDNSQELTTNSDKSQKSTRKSSRNATIQSQEGMSTPENRQSPEEAGTPVLSIQSLLDSSHNSLSRSARRRHSKRKTIGAIRSEARRRDGSIRSKSLNFTARRGLLRLSDDSPKAGERTVTPRSAVKPEQEAVKNKHSTAKKPQSKRAIIDEIADADVARQLFNSPVKRKLSQSMTEFSRELTDDEAARKPTRRTIAAIGRTPDNSLLQDTEAYTPDRFVSPLNTPDSPNLSGVKRLFDKNTPENDLRDVRGLKRLMRTPKPRRSIANDLTDVAGVKRVFARSPENRLSDVRVKGLWAGVPKDDLRRVSGVKRALQRNSPRNDLSDVRGVKRAFGRGPRDELDDVSGVEELFDASGDSNREDSAFDRLLGKPTVKQVYSRSLVRSVNKLKTKRGKTLHASIDAITANVEEWLDKELEKRLQREKKADKSERESRSESHLPIKKRSSANARRSANTSVKSGSTSVKSGSTSLRRSATVRQSATLPPSPSSSLPLKKRPLVHSTPLKGRPRMPDPPRSSPIPPLVGDGPTEELTAASPKPQPKAKPPTPAVRNTRTTRHNADTPRPSPKPSPVKPPRLTVSKPSPVFKPAPAASPSKSTKPAPRTRRAKAEKEDKNNKESPKKDKESPRKTRARKQTEKTPPKSPKRTRKQVEKVAKEPEAPKPTRTRKQAEIEPPMIPKTRGRKETKQATPKAKTPTRATRARLQKGTVVVAKPSPQLKPQPKKTEETAAVARKSRKTAASEVAVEAKRRKLGTPKESPKTTRASKKTTEKTQPETKARSKSQQKPEPEIVEKSTRRRGRAEVAEPVVIVRKQAARNKKAPEKAAPKKVEKVTTTRTKKAAVPAPKQKADKVAPTRNVDVASRNRKAEVPTKGKPEERPSRKRKAAAEEVVPRKAAKATAEDSVPREKRSTAKAEPKAAGKETRAARAKAVAASDKPTKPSKPAAVAKPPSGRSRRR